MLMIVLALVFLLLTIMCGVMFLLTTIFYDSYGGYRLLRIKIGFIKATVIGTFFTLSLFFIGINM